MKKLIALLLALCMVLSMVACGAKTETPAPEAPKTEAPKAEEPKKEEPKVEENLTATQKIIKEVLVREGLDVGTYCCFPYDYLTEGSVEKAMEQLGEDANWLKN